MKIKPFNFGLEKTERKRSLTSADKKRIAAEQGYNCKKCSNRLKTRYHIDHIKPFSQGGSDSARNLQALCSNCHDEKTEEERHVKRQKKIREQEKRVTGSSMPSLFSAPKGSDVNSLLFGKPSKKKKKDELSLF